MELWLKKNISNIIIENFQETQRPYIKSVNNYDKEFFKSLPIDGWIKPCSNKLCQLPTSKFIIINEFKKYYFCPNCLNNDKYMKILKINNLSIYRFETNYQKITHKDNIII